MALITSCQATFQNFSGYEDDLASLEENIREWLLRDHENLGTDQYVRPEEFISAQKWRRSRRI